MDKLEARLRFGGLPYRTEAGSVRKGPRGKIPYLAIATTNPGGDIAGSPTILADSSLISEKLVEDGLMVDLNAKLSPVEKVQDLALRALIEEKLYFPIVSLRILRASRKARSTCTLPKLKTNG